MIIIHVEVPIMGHSYDFQIDENTPMSEVKEEITDMICRRNQCLVEGPADQLMMWNKAGHQLLARERTAYENGLHSGSEILLA